MTAPRPTVYVIDDDLSFRRAVSRLLEAAGYEVHGYSSAESFLADAPRTRKDTCVLCDVRMSGHDGIDVQRVLRERGSLLAVVFVTAYSDRHTEEQARAGGAVDFLTKPVGKDRLLGAVEQALSVAKVSLGQDAGNASSRGTRRSRM